MTASIVPSMASLISTLWLIAFAIAVLGGIPYLIFIVRTTKQKRWSKLALLLVVPTLSYGALYLSSDRIDELSYQAYLKDIYGTRAGLGKAVSQQHSERSFNGDGASMEVYPLSDSIRTRFESADDRFLKSYPKQPGYRSGWIKQHWRRSPIDPAFSQYVSFALFAAHHEESEKIRAALSRPGAFYSFFHYDHGNSPGNIDMFIVDLQGGLIYQINVNT